MKQAITGETLPKPVGPYSIAVQSGNTLYLSGQIPLNAQGEIVSSSITDAVAVIMNNITEILKAAGMDLSHVVKTTVFSASMDYFTEFNECYAKYFSAPFPARSFVEVSRLPKNALIEIEAIAVK
jgi:2-iminobutanoate/2-iminopropanoate deaminase